MRRFFSFCLIALFTLSKSPAQNLPSLLTDKNINATFSIVAYDAEKQEWGIAVTTNNIYVGNSTIYVEPGVGAFSVIAETNPDYGLNGLEALKNGSTVEQAIEITKVKDQQAHYRQVSGIDKNGNVAAFTGEALKYWMANSDHLLGENFVVMGNQLDDQVLNQMATSFEQAEGTLAERLLVSLIQGQLAGGQVSGKQSAALVVKGTDKEWYNQIDLRVDHSKQPFADLQRLLDYHYGRIQLNQANYAFRNGNMERAQNKLQKAERLLDGWTGMYSKLALTNSLLGQKDQAVAWIKEGLLENPYWKVNLPAFYYLRKEPALSALIQPSLFTVKDWQAAIQMLMNLNRTQEANLLTLDVLDKGMESSYLYYQLAKSYLELDQNKAAKVAIKKAISLDERNVEAHLFLEKLSEK